MPGLAKGVFQHLPQDFRFAQKSKRIVIVESAKTCDHVGLAEDSLKAEVCMLLQFSELLLVGGASILTTHKSVRLCVLLVLKQVGEKVLHF